MKVGKRTNAASAFLSLSLLIFLTGCVLTSCTVKDPYTEEFSQRLKEQAEKEKNEPKKDVVLVVRNFKKGEKFDADSLKPAKLPKSKVPSGALASPSEAIGKTARFDIKIGSVLIGQYVNP